MNISGSRKANPSMERAIPAVTSRFQQYLLPFILFTSLFFLPSVSFGIFTENNNVWQCRVDFAKRFTRDEDTATNELKGAEALAIRLVPLSRLRCHGEGKEKKCVPSWQWLLDIYFTMDSDIGIEGDAARQFKPLRSSVFFLGQRDPSLKKRWEEVFALKGGRLFLVRNGKREEGFFDVISYKRPIRQGIQMVTVRVDSDLVEQDPEVPRIIEFTDKDGKVLCQITAPVSYWQRVAEYRQTFSKLNALNWQGGVELDPNQWVYTKEFAEKYGMPKENISADMDGAMAISYRIDNTGVKMCGYFGDDNSCSPVWDHNWGFYLPAESEVHYVSPEMDNFTCGYDDSEIFIRRKAEYDYEGTSLEHRVYYKGIEYTGYAYRLYKKNFFGFRTNEKTKWFGGGVYNKAYIQPQVLNAGFTYTEFGLNYLSSRDIGVDTYLVFDDDNSSVKYNETKSYTRVRIPESFMHRMLAYRKKFEADKGSFLNFVKDEWSKHSVEAKEN